MTWYGVDFSAGESDDVVDVPTLNAACFARFQTEDSRAGFDAELR
jgi:hypothetical protein